MAGDTVEHLRSRGRRVFFDAEHFYGYGANPKFALAVARAAVEAGAERLVLCDTNGGTLPHQIVDVIGKVRAELPEAEIGVHFHNDSGCAVASSLAAVGAGVRQLQGCVNGYGERTGNADLCTIIPDLALKMGIPVVTDEQLGALSSDLPPYRRDSQHRPRPAPAICGCISFHPQGGAPYLCTGQKARRLRAHRAGAGGQPHPDGGIGAGR